MWISHRGPHDEESASADQAAATVTALLHEGPFMPLFNWACLHHTRSAGKALAVLLKGQAELALDSEHVQLSACGWLPVTSPVVASHRYPNMSFQ